MSGYKFLRNILFKFDPELIHGLTVRLMQLTGKIKIINRYIAHRHAIKSNPIEVCGLKFANKVGLAAGYDKDGLGWKGLAALGFGHIEIGTVTPDPQKGNPKPRIFRLIQDQAIINRMGFPGKGADFVEKQVKGPKPEGLVLGINIGKQKDTSLDCAYQDYVYLVRKFAEYADYFAINISSPNTEGLRELLGREYLENLMDKIIHERDNQSSKYQKEIPLFVKLSPDLTEQELKSSLDILIKKGVDGIIATNTTLGREGLSSAIDENGGLSGAPLTKKSTKSIKFISEYTDGKLPIIAVGGIMNADDAEEKIKAGASLVQIFTGLIYTGPSLVISCSSALSNIK
jgi:dihydroorotate dehydrogenase